MARVPSYDEVSKSLEQTGEAEYIGHTITPTPFSLGYSINGDQIDDERWYADLEEALAAIRATIEEPDTRTANEVSID